MKHDPRKQLCNRTMLSLVDLYLQGWPYKKKRYPSDRIVLPHEEKYHAWQQIDFAVYSEIAVALLQGILDQLGEGGPVQLGKYELGTLEVVKCSTPPYRKHCYEHPFTMGYWPTLRWNNPNLVYKDLWRLRISKRKWSKHIVKRMRDDASHILMYNDYDDNPLARIDI